MKRIDKAAAKGVIHANQASRRKSRLVRRIAALTRRGHRGELSALPLRRRFVARRMQRRISRWRAEASTAGLPPSSAAVIAGSPPDIPSSQTPTPAQPNWAAERGLESHRDGVVEPGLVPLPGSSNTV